MSLFLLVDWFETARKYVECFPKTLGRSLKFTIPELKALALNELQTILPNNSFSTI